MVAETRTHSSAHLCQLIEAVFPIIDSQQVLVFRKCLDGLHNYVAQIVQVNGWDDVGAVTVADEFFFVVPCGL